MRRGAAPVVKAVPRPHAHRQQASACRALADGPSDGETSMAFRSTRGWAAAGVRRAFVVGALGAGIAGAATAAGCGSGGGSAPQPTPPKAIALGGSAPHAIHVFVKNADGTKQQLDFGQGTEISLGGPQKTGEALGAQAHTLGLPHIAVTPDTTSGDDSGQSGPTVDSPGNDIWGTAWALVARAAVQCGVGAGLPPWGWGAVTVPRRQRECDHKSLVRLFGLRVSSTTKMEGTLAGFDIFSLGNQGNPRSCRLHM